VNNIRTSLKQILKSGDQTDLFLV